MADSIKIVPFAKDLAPFFTSLNLAWIRKYFSVEPMDEAVLGDPQTNILDKGGHIFFALYNGKVVGTFALMKTDRTTFELSKMAVEEQFQGLKVGHAMMEAAIQQAKALGAGKLILYSNTVLGPAIHLYKKYGFVEVPLASSLYKRSNIKMERNLTPGPSPEGEGSGALQHRGQLHRQATPVLFKHAKDLRQTETVAEQMLWDELRNRRLEGLKFRRQHPIGQYIADFYCHEKALVIELDGSIHRIKENKDYDAARDKILIESGITVLRFTNDEVLKNLTDVLEKIKEVISVPNNQKQEKKL